MKKGQHHNPRLRLIELNEANIELILKYIEKYNLTGLRAVLNSNAFETTSETKYDLLEPWIQWVSVHTGKNAEDHGVFRLGDITKFQGSQVFEKLEAKGYCVGSIGAINAENRLCNPSYFIPDPWTDTPSDSAFWSEIIATSVKDLVNQNSAGNGKIASYLWFGLALLRFFRIKNLALYIRLLINSRSRPWSKALLLDVFNVDLYLKLESKKRSDFSVLFLNSLAHIQHHYLLRSEFLTPKGAMSDISQHDPIKDALMTFDKLIPQLFVSESEVETLIATGLSQTPYPAEKYYYRLKFPAKFFASFGIEPLKVQQRMSRDMEVFFADSKDQAVFSDVIASIKCNGLPLFGDLEKREGSTFLSLTYPNKIDDDDKAVHNNTSINLSDEVAFVAIKNGEHCQKGYGIYSDGLKPFIRKKTLPIWRVHDVILDYFKVT